MTWKILITQIRGEIYYSIVCYRKFPEELKGCRKRTIATNDQVYIDEYIVKEAKTRRKHMAISWIDYKKAYDMVPQTWIIAFENV